MINLNKKEIKTYDKGNSILEIRGDDFKRLQVFKRVYELARNLDQFDKNDQLRIAIKDLLSSKTIWYMLLCVRPGVFISQNWKQEEFPKK